jgi:hypothetical protein
MIIEARIANRRLGRAATKKGGQWPPFLLPKHCPWSDASVYTLAAAIIAAICLRTATIESPIDLIALAIEPVRQTITTCRLGAVRLPVESTINTITFLVQALFNAIAAIVESVFDAITGIGKCSPADDQQRNTYCDCFPGIHVKSPLYPYKMMRSVCTTEAPGIG